MTIDAASGTAVSTQQLSSVPPISDTTDSWMVRNISGIWSTVSSPLTLRLSQTTLPSSPGELVSNFLTNSANVCHRLLETRVLGCAAPAVGAFGMVAALLQQKISDDGPAQESSLLSLLPDEALRFAASAADESLRLRLRLLPSSDIREQQRLWGSDNNHIPAVSGRAEAADAATRPGNSRQTEGEQTTRSVSFVLTSVDAALSWPPAVDARALPPGGNGTMTADFVANGPGSVYSCLNDFNTLSNRAVSIDETLRQESALCNNINNALDEAGTSQSLTHVSGSCLRKAPQNVRILENNNKLINEELTRTREEWLACDASSPTPREESVCQRTPLGLADDDNTEPARFLRAIALQDKQKQLTSLQQGFKPAIDMMKELHKELKQVPEDADAFYNKCSPSLRKNEENGAAAIQRFIKNREDICGKISVTSAIEDGVCIDMTLDTFCEKGVMKIRSELQTTISQSVKKISTFCRQADGLSEDIRDILRRTDNEIISNIAERVNPVPSTPEECLDNISKINQNSEFASTALSVMQRLQDMEMNAFILKKHINSLNEIKSSIMNENERLSEKHLSIQPVMKACAVPEFSAYIPDTRNGLTQTESDLKSLSH